jgi:hypothetical protein
MLEKQITGATKNEEPGPHENHPAKNRLDTACVLLPPLFESVRLRYFRKSGGVVAGTRDAK